MKSIEATTPPVIDKSKPVMERIKTVKDAFNECGLDINNLPDVSAIPKCFHKFIQNMYIAAVLTKALNEGWEPNWNDSSEWKYYPWTKVSADKKRPAGFGFSLSSCDYSRSSSSVGSRLCFKNSKLAIYVTKQFPEVYIPIMLMVE